MTNFGDPLRTDDYHKRTNLYVRANKHNRRITNLERRTQGIEVATFSYVGTPPAFTPGHKWRAHHDYEIHDVSVQTGTPASGASISVILVRATGPVAAISTIAFSGDGGDDVGLEIQMNGRDPNDSTKRGDYLMVRFNASGGASDFVIQVRLERLN